MRSNGKDTNNITPRSAVVLHQSSGNLADYRSDVGAYLNHPLTEVGLASLVIVSFALLVLETDEAAPQNLGEEAQRPSLALMVISKILVFVFTIELMVRIFVDGRKYFDSHGISNFVVTIGDLILSILDICLGSVPQIAFLRCFRLIRLMRLNRIVKWVPELGFMIQGMVSAFVTVLWGIVFVVAILLFWSLLAVQILHPINLEVEAQGLYDGCSRCPRAFSSTWDSFLTFAQTLVFGDSWGAVALPIIEEKWWTVGIFLVAFATIGLAAMNLILATIVDSGAQAREAALTARSENVKRREAEGKKKNANRLLELCQELDSDESGKLSREELLVGYDQNQDFREAVRGMKFSREDIEVLFNILDKDCSDDVDYTEFLDVMQHTQGEDTQQMMIFMKFAIMDLWIKREKEDRFLERKIDEIKTLVAAKFSESTPSESASSLNLPVQLKGMQQLFQSQPAPQPQPQVQLKAKSPKKKAAPAEQGQKGTPRISEADYLAREPSRPPPHVKEPKDTGNDEVMCKLVGDWHSLETATLVTNSNAADNSVESRLHLELVRVLKKIACHTEAHTRSLQNLDRALSGHPPTWRRGRDWPEGLETDAVTVQVESAFDPPPPPPSGHGPRHVLNSRVGL